jgi:hypothetical protein
MNYVIAGVFIGVVLAVLYLAVFHGLGYASTKLYNWMLSNQDITVLRNRLRSVAYWAVFGIACGMWMAGSIVYEVVMYVR